MSKNAGTIRRLQKAGLYGVIDAKQYITEHLPQTEILAQLAEEAAELAQAALKLRRCYDGTNPTPMKWTTAKESLLEEYGDVLDCMELLITPTESAQVAEQRKEKFIRWESRLREKKGRSV